MKAAFGHITCYFGMCVCVCDYFVWVYLLFLLDTQEPHGLTSYIKCTENSQIIKLLLANHYLQNNQLFAYSREEPSNKSMKNP